MKITVVKSASLSPDLSGSRCCLQRSNPVLTGLINTIFKGQQMAPGIFGAYWYGVILMVIVMYAAAV